MKHNLMLLMLVALVSSAIAFADETGFTLGVGSTGTGLHLTAPVKEVSGDHVDASYFYTGPTSDVNVDVKLKLQILEDLADWYPMSGRFDLSAGFMRYENRLHYGSNANSSSSTSPLTNAGCQDIAGIHSRRNTAFSVGTSDLMQNK